MKLGSRNPCLFFRELELIDRNKQYADQKGARLINASDVGAMADVHGFLYYQTLEWHIVHCYFYWIKARRARDNGVTMEKRYDSEGHIRHCAGVFLTRGHDLQAVRTFSGISLTSDE